MDNQFEHSRNESATSVIGENIELAHDTVAEIASEMDSLHWKRTNVLQLLNEIQSKLITVKGVSKHAGAQRRIDEALVTALRDYDAQYASLETEYEEAKATYAEAAAERSQLN
jgi:hypothetical protein